MSAAEQRTASITEILEFNRRFVEGDKAQPFKAGRTPKKQLAIVTCMDTRLITLLTAALGLENGDANIIKVAGAEVQDPFGAPMRSLLVAVYELGVTDIMIIAHTECGAQHMSGEGMAALMKQAGITEAAFEAVGAQGVDLDNWLEGFGDTEDAVRRSVATIQTHPLMPSHVNTYGFIIETQTGRLTPVTQFTP